MNDYTRFAEIYDDFVDEQFQSRLIEVLEHFCRRFPPPGRRMLDVACGTGTVTLRFAEKGWSVTGIDLSEAMLAKASGKGALAGLAIELHCADMRNFRLPGEFDLVTCNSDSINHLSGESAAAATFASVANALAPGGVFIFDANTPHTLRNKWSDHTISGRRGLVSYSWHHSYDEKTATGRLEATFKVSRDGETATFTERFQERAFEADDIEQLLRGAGLSPLEAADFFSLAPLAETSVRATFVAGKPA